MGLIADAPLGSDIHIHKTSPMDLHNIKKDEGEMVYTFYRFLILQSGHFTKSKHANRVVPCTRSKVSVC